MDYKRGSVKKEQGTKPTTITDIILLVLSILMILFACFASLKNFDLSKGVAEWERPVFSQEGGP